MKFIRTYYTREAYDRDTEKSRSLIAYIVETGEVIYTNTQVFNSDFNDDFELLDEEYYKKLFKMYT